MQAFVEALQATVDQLGRFGISNLALFLFFVAIYVVTAAVIFCSRRFVTRLVGFLVNQIFTAAAVLVAFKSALPATFPWKETLGMALLGFAAAFLLMRLLRSRGAEGQDSTSKDISRRARKLAEATQKAAALKALDPAVPAAAQQPDMIAPTASDISRRIESHSRKRGPALKTATQGGFGRR